LDKKLLKAADLAAKRYEVNRSALIRQALDRHLKYLHELELEDLDRRGYLARPQREEEFRIWEDAASWPRR
jgi:metal-responsive CopG/Arc/MetJ family transcriptional regulator